MKKDKKEGNSLKEFFSFGEVLNYYFRKKDSNRKADINLKMMHGINKIAIMVFVAGMIYFIVKKVFFQ